MSGDIAYFQYRRMLETDENRPATTHASRRGLHCLNTLQVCITIELIVRKQYDSRTSTAFRILLARYKHNLRWLQVPIRDSSPLAAIHSTLLPPVTLHVLQLRLIRPLTVRRSKRSCAYLRPLPHRRRKRAPPRPSRSPVLHRQREQIPQHRRRRHRHRRRVQPSTPLMTLL